MNNDYRIKKQLEALEDPLGFQAQEAKLLEEPDQAMECVPPDQYRIKDPMELRRMNLLESKMYGTWRITRVPTGWIFENACRNGYPVFVPYVS